MQNEGGAKPFEAADIRFTTKAGVLYALPMAWPEASLRIESLAGAPGDVRRVTLLGGTDPLPFRREAGGLAVDLPARRPAFTPVLKLEGPGLT